MASKTYMITPVAKCRQTQRDRWLNPPRPCVAKYRAFKDEVRLKGVGLPESGFHILFMLPIPKSWSNQKQQEMCMKPHQVRPDLDNLCKALFDATYQEDSVIWDYRATKLWGKEGSITIQDF